MGILTKVTDLFRKKEYDPIYGGIELLSRMTGGAWSKTKMLQQYEKSLYVYACVSKIAEKVASIDFDLYQILNSKGDTKEVFGHEVLDLLYKPNEFQTKSEFIEITMINLNLAGDAFWFKVRDERGHIVELWNLRPDFVKIVKDPEKFIKAYIFRKQDGSEEVMNPEDIVHFKSASPLDVYYGVSPVESASVRIDTESYASQYQRDFFLNNGRPDGIIKSVSGYKLSPEQKQDIAKEFENKHRGVGKNSKIAIMQGQLEYQQVSINQREMDYIESMKFTRDDILVAFGVPKAIVSITDDVNRANAETSMRIFLSEVINPQTKRLVEKTNQELIIPDYGENLFLTYEDPTPEDRELTLKEYESGIKNGYMVMNEVRSKENLEPIDGGWDLYIPLNLRSVGRLSETKKRKIFEDLEEKRNRKSAIQASKMFRGREMLRESLKLKENILKELRKEFKKPDRKEITKTLKNAKKVNVKKVARALISSELRDDYANMIIKASIQREQILKKDMNALAGKQLAELISLIEKEDVTKTKAGNKRKKVGKETTLTINLFYNEQAPVFEEFIYPFIATTARESGAETMAMIDPNETFEMTNALTESLQKRAKEFGLGVNNTTREKVLKTMSDGIEEGEGIQQIAGRIKEVYKGFPDYRSEMIARTETIAATNEATLGAYNQSEVTTHKEWIAVMDDRTRPEHAELNGEIKELGKAFSNGLQYPSEPNCRCVLGPASDL